MNSFNIYNQKQEKIIFGYIKSNVIIKKIFNHMKRYKSFEIIKYNKACQERLNLSIKDYKEYSQLYTPIEIELNLVDNKYGKFINISYEEKEYFHIYFDNSNEEIKRYLINENEKVKMIKIIIDCQIFNKFHRINITDMSDMFCGCSFLKELNLSKFNTNNVNNMMGMFYECSSLKELNLSNFNTNNVTNMSHMFGECSSLNELNLSNFNTNKVTNMYGMFRRCSLLKELNLSNFNTNNVTNMFNMFSL